MRQRKKEARRLGFALTAYLLSLTIMQLILTGVLNNAVPGMQNQPWYIWVLTSIPNYLVGVPIFFWVTRKLPDAELPEKKPFPVSDWVRYSLISLATGYLFSIVGSILNYPFVRLFNISENIVIDILNISSLPLSIIFIVILAPIMEELVFRKRFLTKALSFGRRNAVIAGGLAFGLFHMNIPQAVYATALGILWGTLFLKYGSVLPVILLHMSMNLMGSIVFPLIIASHEILGIVITVFAVLTIFIVGLVLFSREKKSLQAVWQEPVPIEEEEAAEIGHESEVPFEPVFIEETPSEEPPVEQPSLIRNAGYLSYIVLVLALFALSLLGASIAASSMNLK